jgi:uncharacterized protein YggE
MHVWGEDMRYFFILAAVALAAMANSAAASELLDPKTVVVTGAAQVEVAPDYATITLGVVSKQDAAAAALKANGALMQKVVAAIRAQGIPDHNISTSQFQIEAIHPADKAQPYRSDESITLGYVATNTLTITVEKLDSVATVIDAAVNSGANMTGSVYFGIRDTTASNAKALTMAVANARRQAEIMAAAEHAKVGHVVAMTTAPDYRGGNRNTSPPPPPPPPPPVAGAVIMPGHVTVDATVLVVFALE